MRGGDSWIAIVAVYRAEYAIMEWRRMLNCALKVCKAGWIFGKSTWHRKVRGVVWVIGGYKYGMAIIGLRR